MSSFNRGTPSVTFLAPTPAKWKVFRVICVAGSPTLCAATTPITSPASTHDRMKRCFTSPRSQSTDALLNCSCSKSFREAKWHLRCAFKMIFALSSTSRPIVSPSAMALVISSCAIISFTLWAISMGVYLLPVLPRSSCNPLILARPMILAMLMGICCFESPSGKTSLQIMSFISDNLLYSASRICWCSTVDLMAARVSGGSHLEP
mmetsp:Transcript_95530/g.270216  ORF Transcript_95530/g.270216 Transcript_95530/m.270216 type:complete len:206 (-) Transcript_95530:2835-3452(-)